MRKEVATGIAILIGAIAQAIIDRLIDWSAAILSPIFSNISLSDIILIIGIAVGIPLIAWGTLRSRLNVERIARVQAFVFFPKNTKNEDLTLDYHQKHFHHRLIVNFKTSPPEAYPIPAPDSYPWKLITKYSDLWKSIKIQNLLSMNQNLKINGVKRSSINF